MSAQTATEAVSSSSEQPFPIPTPDGADKTYSPKITKLANDISSLTLLECADLSSLLKKQLNLPDAPMMAMGAFAQAPIAAAPVVSSSLLPPNFFTFYFHHVMVFWGHFFSMCLQFYFSSFY